jgi:ferredoxin
MPRITIDGQPIEVAEDATLLDAAELLGIEIPTLCHLKGYEPSTSCLVCVVQDRNTGKFVPACATRAVDGMEIDNGTEAVRDMRRTALELLLSDHVGDCLAPCHFACPAHMDIPLMLRQIGAEQIREAIATIKHDIALPAVLGRVCPKPCEKGCRRRGADQPVAVCDLKRYVADSDLDDPQPYQPPCRPDSGRRVAIVGAGTTGLAAAYYLRQYGHACVLIDREAQAGGRLREESPDVLPPNILDAEIAQILSLGIETRWSTTIETKSQFDALREEFDAVLLACGNTGREQIETWGLQAAQRGIAVDRVTNQTDHADVFATGCAVRGKCLIVRSAADGKEVAETMDQFLQGRTVRGPARPFSCRIHRPSEDEMAEFLEGAGSACRADPAEGEDFSSAAATEQSERCLSCDCAAHGDCKLERYAIMYDANATRFSGEKRPYEVIGRHSKVMFEPGKCIKCELCVKIASAAKEPLGLSFVGRGFDVQLEVPFGHDMDEALTKVAAECVAACPTAALQFAKRNFRELVQIGEE